MLDARSLLIIGAATAGWAFSFGLGSQAVSHWLKSLAINDTVIGLNHASYYFGLAAASCLVPAMTRRIGPIWCAAIGMVSSGITLAVFPLINDANAWYLLRFLNGCAGAMSLVPLETIVSRDSAPERRTLSFGIYGVSLTLGGALGVSMAPFLYPAGYGLAFAAGGCAAIGAGVLVHAGMRKRPDAAHESGDGAPLDWLGNFLSYGTAWSQGFLEGGMIAFLALYLEWRGLSAEVAGSLVGATMIGVILFQVPVSWLADRFGTTAVLLACYVGVIGGLVTIPWLADALLLGVVLFAFGACTGAMYPLGLSLLGGRLAESYLARAFAWYLAVECMGSVLGAAAMGKAREIWGESAMFPVGLVVVLAVLVVWIVLRSASRLIGEKQTIQA